MKRVGILGGGQLGMMLAEAVFALGADVRIFDPDPNAPALRRIAGSVSGAWTDLDALRAFADGCDVVTYEMEHIDTSALSKLTCPIAPSIDVLEVTQDRVREKSFLRDAGLPHVAFVSARGASEIAERADEFGFPFILKTARGGYDGKGQWMVASRADLDAALADVRTRADDVVYVLEDVVALELEASCIVARDGHGHEVAFPIFENAHAAHILDVTVVPARVPPAVAEWMREIAIAAARKLDVVGVLTTEFFLTSKPAARSNARRVDGVSVYVNELAPRPHNSGHVSRKACAMSQFDALARVLLDVPLATPALRPGAFAMANLLGDVYGPERALDLAPLADHPEVLELFLYGKHEPAPKRKMGHLLLGAETADQAAAAARDVREAIRRASRRALT
jgi:5-(carboxyamino)imidazole ribonucleotide synthase